MNSLRLTPDFGMDNFNLGSGFDINAAFQEAVHGVAIDTELLMEEKVRRMALIVSESSSETYRNFVDFRAIAAQMEMYCNHDHAFGEAAKSNETLSGFASGMANEDDHDHHHGEDDDEDDPKKAKKKKKSRGWFGVFT